MKVSVIGTGNMGSAIVHALCASAGPENVFISNRSRSKAETLATSCGCIACSSNIDCCIDADYVFLGVKPDIIRSVLQEIGPYLKEQQVIVSMAAGVTGDAMLGALDKKCPVVRILPNTPCAIGKGLVLVAPCANIQPNTLSELQVLLAPCGMVALTDEAHADAGMTVGGCTPAYTFMYIDALADGAVKSGIPRAEAIRWAAQAVAGAAELLLQTGSHPAVLKDAVCSPGGSTIEGVRALEEAAFRASVIDAFSASFEKNRNLGK